VNRKVSRAHGKTKSNKKYTFSSKGKSRKKKKKKNTRIKNKQIICLLTVETQYTS
jgi:hypothetical protein